MSKKQAQEVRLCRDCRHARPVTWEYLSHDRQPIFCVCPFVPFYHFLNHDVIHRNCQHYEKNDNPTTGGPAADGVR